MVIWKLGRATLTDVLSIVKHADKYMSGSNGALS